MGIEVMQDSSSVALSGVTKTATFNSKKYNPGGAKYFGIILNLGTVSGTGEDLNIKVQMTLDDGTTWLDCYPDGANSETQAALAEITATKETCEYWLNVFSPAVAGFSQDATAITPRVRFVFTISGTGASFAITNCWFFTIHED